MQSALLCCNLLFRKAWLQCEPGMCGMVTKQQISICRGVCPNKEMVKGVATDCFCLFTMPRLEHYQSHVGILPDTRVMELFLTSTLFSSTTTRD